MIQPQDPVSASRAVINSNFSQIYGNTVPTTIGQLGQTVAATGPAWSSLATNLASLYVNINNYPPADLFGAGTVGLPEGIRAAMVVPVTSNTGNAANALAGYCETYSAVTGCVGSAGFAFPKIASASVWGANFLTSNCPTGAGGNCHNTGLQNITAYGIEVDAGIANLPGGISPNTAVRGIYVQNGGEGTTANPTFNAYEADHVTQAWHNSFYSRDGAADQAGLYLGAAAAGAGQFSQKIVLHAESAGSAPLDSTLQSDASGNLIINPGSGSSLIALQDGAANTLMALTAGTVSITTGNNFTMGAAGQFTNPAIKSISGQRFVCVDTAGHYVSSASACSGT